MKKIFFIYCLYLSICNIPSQDTSFIYELKYKPSSSKDYYKNELFYLDVSDKESIFRSAHERSSDSLIQKIGYGIGFKIFYNHQYYTQKILAEKKVYKIISTPIFSDIYSLPIENLDWKITKDKLKIGNFNCQKAELKYGGRSWIAWFAQEIPLQEGPYIFNGLPGLIIKISDDTSDYNFELVKIKKDLNQISHLKPKKEITLETLKKLETDFYNEPYAEVKARNIGYVNANEKGERIDISMKKMTESMQKNIRDNDNSIELNQAVKD
jgi:GLPGLI family protein